MTLSGDNISNLLETCVFLCEKLLSSLHQKKKFKLRVECLLTYTNTDILKVIFELPSICSYPTFIIKLLYLFEGIARTPARRRSEQHGLRSECSGAGPGVWVCGGHILPPTTN